MAADAMTDLSELKRLAEAATPGPWHHCQPFVVVPEARTVHGRVPAERVDYVSTWPGPGTPIGHRVVIGQPGREGAVRSEDMAFIAALNPATALALIARVEELEALLASRVTVANQAITEADAALSLLQEENARLRGPHIVGRHITMSEAETGIGNAVLNPDEPADGCYWTLIGSGPDADQNRLGHQIVEAINRGLAFLASTPLEGGWRGIESAPKDGTEVALFYRDWCGGGPLVTQGSWVSEPGREWEETWHHLLGTGNADFWAPLLAPPVKGE